MNADSPAQPVDTSTCSLCHAPITAEPKGEPVTCPCCGARTHYACDVLVTLCLTPGCAWWSGAAEAAEEEAEVPGFDRLAALRAAIPDKEAAPDALASFARQLACLEHPRQWEAAGREALLRELAPRRDLGPIARVAGDLLVQSLRRAGDLGGLIAVAQDTGLAFRIRHLAAHLAAPASLPAWSELLGSWSIPAIMEGPTLTALRRHAAAPGGLDAVASFFGSLNVARRAQALARLGPEDAELLPAVATVALGGPPMIEAAAIEAARGIGAPSALPLLRHLEARALPWVQREASEVAEALASKPEADSPALAAVHASVSAAPSPDPEAWGDWLRVKPPPRSLSVGLVIASYLNVITLVGALLVAVGLVLHEGGPVVLAEPWAIVLLIGVVGIAIGLYARGDLSLYRRGVYTRGEVESVERVETDNRADHSRSLKGRRRDVSSKYHYRISILNENGGSVRTTWRRATANRSYAKRGAEVGVVYEPGFESYGRFAAELTADATPGGGFTVAWWSIGLRLLPIAALGVIGAMALGLLPDARETLRF